MSYGLSPIVSEVHFLPHINDFVSLEVDFFDELRLSLNKKHSFEGFYGFFSCLVFEGHDRNRVVIYQLVSGFFFP